MVDNQRADRRGDAARADQQRLRPRRARRSERGQRGGDADLGRVLVRDPVGVLPALRRQARRSRKTYPAMKKYLDEWLPQWSGKDGDRLRLHAELRPRRLGSADRRRRAARRADALRDPEDHRPVLDRVRGLHGEDRGRLRPARWATPPTRPTSTSCSTKVKADFNAKWWDATRRLLPRERDADPGADDPGPGAGVRPRARRTAAAALQEKLINDIMVTRAGHEMVGIVGSRWIFPVLTQAAREGVPGAAKAAYTIAQQTTYPSYGYWARARLDVAGRVLGGVEPHAQPPHVRLDRAVVLRGPGGHRAAQARLRGDRVQAADRDAGSTTRRRPTTRVRGTVKSSWEQVDRRHPARRDRPAERDRARVRARHRPGEGGRGRQRHAAGRRARARA